MNEVSKEAHHPTVSNLVYVLIHFDKIYNTRYIIWLIHIFHTFHLKIGESEEQPNERELDGKELMETSLKLVEDILKIREVITFLNLSLLTDTPYYSTYINLLIHVDLLLYIGFGW